MNDYKEIVMALRTAKEIVKSAPIEDCVPVNELPEEGET